jgi:hypothetical protein
MHRDASSSDPATADQGRTDGGAARSAEPGWPGAAVLNGHEHQDGSVFLVERVMPGLQSRDLPALQRVLEEACRRVSGDSQFVRYLRSTFVPSQGRWIAMFHASGVDAVERVNELAQIPGLRIEPVTEMSAVGD